MPRTTQPRITKAGRVLAVKLEKSIGVPMGIGSLCSTLVNKAQLHHRLMEEACNGPPEISRYVKDGWQDKWQADLEKRIERCEARIMQLVWQLPTINGQGIVPVFSGDPRGATVKLKMPDGRYDDWGQVGICVLE